MILEEVTQSVLAIVATAVILTLFLRMVAVALKAVAEGDRKMMIAAVFFVGCPRFCPCDCVLGRELMEVQRCCWKP